jgi:hypothetical protein
MSATIALSADVMRRDGERFLRGFDGIPQLEGYTRYNRVTRPSRKDGDPIRLAHCSAHARRKLMEVFDRDPYEIAAEGLSKGSPRGQRQRTSPEPQLRAHRAG